VGKAHGTLRELIYMFMRRLWRDCSAASLIEYCLAVGFITTLIIVGAELAGSWVHRMWAQLLGKLSG
jgi:Flp pilus assembly pilin Flp